MPDLVYKVTQQVTIAVDFDGTIAEHRYPEIGKPVPGALETLHWLQDMGVKLILWTMRPTKYAQEAARWCAMRGIRFAAVNTNTNQGWTDSRKVYADLYIDDSALGCPVIPDSEGERDMVDWDQVRTLLNLHFSGVRNAS